MNCNKSVCPTVSFFKVPLQHLRLPLLTSESVYHRSTYRRPVLKVARVCVMLFAGCHDGVC